MTDSFLFASSWRYVAQPLIIIPVEDHFAIFEGFPPARDYITTISSAELTDWLRIRFSRQQSLHEERKQKEAERRPLPIDLDLSLDLNIDL